MKIFLQHKRTLLYLAGIDQWVKSSAEALDFPNYDMAVAFASQHTVSGVQVILKFSDCPYNILLPFRKQLPQTNLQA